MGEEAIDCGLGVLEVDIGDGFGAAEVFAFLGELKDFLVFGGECGGAAGLVLGEIGLMDLVAGSEGFFVGAGVPPGVDAEGGGEGEAGGEGGGDLAEGADAGGLFGAFGGGLGLAFGQEVICFEAFELVHDLAEVWPAVEGIEAEGALDDFAAAGFPGGGGWSGPVDEGLGFDGL